MRNAEFEKFLRCTEDKVRRWINKGECDPKAAMVIWIAENNSQRSFTGWQVGKLFELVYR